MPAPTRRWLTAEERDACARLATSDLRARAVAARVFTRGILGRAMRQPPGAVRLTTSRYGKALVRDGPQFSLSHSGSVAVVAVHPWLPVGIDVEQRDRAVSGDSLASCLSPAEEGVPPSDRAGWLRLWVRKEAVIKALGLGLSSDLTTFDVGHTARAAYAWWSLRRDDWAPLQICTAELPTGDPIALAVVSGTAPGPVAGPEQCDAAELVRTGTLLSAT